MQRNVTDECSHVHIFDDDVVDDGLGRWHSAAPLIIMKRIS